MKQSFQDPSRGADGVSVSRVNEHPVDSSIDGEVRAALAAWMDRPDRTSDDAAPFTALGLPAFCNSYVGEIVRYAPDENANRFNEALVRDFLFTDGICNLDRQEPRLFEVNSRMEALEATDLLLVLPFETATGNIAGVMVVDVSGQRGSA